MTPQQDALRETLSMEGAPVMDHDDAGPRVLISIWLLTGMATVFLAVRIWCKFLTRRLLWWDDYILILSWVSELLLVPA